MKVIGIDPGVTGAWALVHSNGEALVNDLIFLEKKPWPILLNYGWSDVDIIFLEVPMRHGPGLLAKTNQWMLFGQLISMIIENDSSDFVPVYPRQWKKHFGLLKSDKEASRLLAISLFPSLEDRLKRKKDHNRAEALLIAQYGLEVHGR